MSGWAQPQCSRFQRQLVGASLDEQIGSEHGIRFLDDLLKEMDWSEWESEYTRERAGRPPIHPRLIAGCILYGLLKRIRSTRDLEEATRMRLDFRWFLDSMVIDHTTFCVFRKTFAKKIESLFKQLNRRAASLKQATLEELIIDGTRLRADSDRHGARTAETLQKRLTLLESQIAAGLEQLAQSESCLESTLTREELEVALRKLETQREKIEKALLVAKERDQAKQQTDGKGAQAVRVPVSDPDASIMPNKEGGYAPNYTPVVAVEPNGLIMAATLAEGNAEAATLVPLIEQIVTLENLPPGRLLVDGGFPTGENLEKLAGDGIEVYAPTAARTNEQNPACRHDPSKPVAEAQHEDLPTRGGKLDRSAFIYDPQTDSYYCPMGQCMPLERTIKRKSHSDKEVSVKEYVCPDCSNCPLAPKCIKGKATQRRVCRDEYESLREELAQRMSSPEAQKIYQRRAPTGERVFAVIKASMDIRRFSVRGKEKVLSEWFWICTAYNLKKLIRQGSSGKKRSAPIDPIASHARKTSNNRSFMRIRPVVRMTLTSQILRPYDLAA